MRISLRTEKHGTRRIGQIRIGLFGGTIDKKISATQYSSRLLYLRRNTRCHGRKHGPKCGDGEIVNLCWAMKTWKRVGPFAVSLVDIIHRKAAHRALRFPSLIVRHSCLTPGGASARSPISVL